MMAQEIVVMATSVFIGDSFNSSAERIVAGQRALVTLDQ
jgi:hypothetical protein